MIWNVFEVNYFTNDSKSGQRVESNFDAVAGKYAKRQLFLGGILDLFLDCSYPHTTHFFCLE